MTAKLSESKMHLAAFGERPHLDDMTMLFSRYIGIPLLAVGSAALGLVLIAFDGVNDRVEPNPQAAIASPFNT